MMSQIRELIESLDGPLAERVRLLKHRSEPISGKFVLYWMRTAVRASENPALSVAIELANRLQLPLLVYQGVSDRYPYASDRHHTFLLEGARDVQVHFNERGIRYALHVDRPGQRGPHLRTLGDQAALVVSEEMPVDPLRRWTKQLSRQLACSFLCVDTACVLPMRLVGKSYERAYEYRDATRLQYQQRISAAPSVETHVHDGAYPSLELPFQSVDLQQMEINELVGECEIDHSIGPVPWSVGGSNAGYDRWNEFKRVGLAKYDRQRNDALVDGVSRMSAYLHYGMVSPMRIARETAIEAARDDSKGAEKYLDELLIWRELAYAFCMYRADHGRTSVLPQWALATLGRHERDPRAGLLSWESMGRGNTGDALWDAAQRSLLVHGELHNNLRMTWGKAILNWTPNAKSALRRIIDLNHRCALDGRDPASYGGILWCLGQFDRPFEPPHPIFGSVRHRSTAEHSKRLDPKAYRRKIAARGWHRGPSVAVIGAGISGLICARTLSDHGIRVTVFEKSRGLGGRMATRRVNESLFFDHGAQYFTVRDERFRRYVRSWTQDGAVQPWRGRIAVIKHGVVTEEKHGTERFVAVPKMNAIGQHLASGLEVQFQTHLSAPSRSRDKWLLTDDRGSDCGRFDVVIVATPAGQAVDLLLHAEQLASEAGRAEMTGCWAVMLAIDGPNDWEFDAAFVHGSPLSWIALNDTKPGRDHPYQAWTLHANQQWSRDHAEDSPEEVERILVDEFWKAVGRLPMKHTHAKAHFWRYALPTKPLSSRCLFDRTRRIGACGDWCGGPRVEGAFLSGMAVAGRVMGCVAEQAADSSHRQANPQMNLF